MLVESIPEGLDFPNASTGNPSTGQAWLGLLAGAHSSLDIASFYWTLTNNDTHTQEPSAQQVPDNLGPGGQQWGSGRHWGWRWGEGFPCSPGDWRECLTEAWTKVFGSNCLYVALWTGGVCHGYLEAFECQGVGLVTRD